MPTGIYSSENRKGFQKGHRQFNTGKSRFKKGNATWNKGLKGYHKGVTHTQETKEKLREMRINNPTFKFKDTKIELKVEAGLLKNKIYYQKQVPLCKIAVVDFYLPEHRVVVQVDGCFWHGCPIHIRHSRDSKKQKERDGKQDAVLTFNGFNVYRFWEHEINESVEKCISRILEKPNS